MRESSTASTADRTLMEGESQPKCISVAGIGEIIVLN